MVKEINLNNLLKYLTFAAQPTKEIPNVSKILAKYLYKVANMQLYL